MAQLECKQLNPSSLKQVLQLIFRRKMSDFWIKLVGVFGCVFATKWLLTTLFKIFYPFKLAPKNDLKKLAGAKWAGKICLNYCY